MNRPGGTQSTPTLPPRLIGRWTSPLRQETTAASPADPPLLLVLGGVHGNEAAGVDAAERVLRELASSPDPPEHSNPTDAAPPGLLALRGNTAGLAEGRRYLHRDLNRIALAEELERPLPPRGDPGLLLDNEGAELRDLLATLERHTAGHTGPRYFLDIHTTSAASVPYLSVFARSEPRPNPADQASLRLAEALPLHRVVGLEAVLAGTIQEYLQDRGWVGFTLEAGQHHHRAAVDHAADAIHVLLAALGSAPPTQATVEARARLAAVSGAAMAGHARRFDLLHRHPVGPQDGFVMKPGYVNFQPVRRGEHLADSHRGPILSPADAFILMPLYQPLGSDGFFLVR